MFWDVFGLISLVFYQSPETWNPSPNSSTIFSMLLPLPFNPDEELPSIRQRLDWADAGLLKGVAMLERSPQSTSTSMRSFFTTRNRLKRTWKMLAGNSRMDCFTLPWRVHAAVGVELGCAEGFRTVPELSWPALPVESDNRKLQGFGDGITINDDKRANYPPRSAQCIRGMHPLSY